MSMINQLLGDGGRISFAKVVAIARQSGLAIVVSHQAMPNARGRAKSGFVSAADVEANMGDVRAVLVAWRAATGMTQSAFADAFDIGRKAVMRVEGMRGSVTVMSIRSQAERLGLHVVAVPIKQADQFVAEALAAAREGGLAPRASQTSDTPSEVSPSTPFPSKDAATIEPRKTSKSPSNKHPAATTPKTRPPSNSARSPQASITPAALLLTQLRARGERHAPEELAVAAGTNVRTFIDSATGRIGLPAGMGALSTVCAALGCDISIVPASVPPTLPSRAAISLGTVGRNSMRSHAMLERMSETLAATDGSPVSMVFPGTQVVTFLRSLELLGLRMDIHTHGHPPDTDSSRGGAEPLPPEEVDPGTDEIEADEPVLVLPEEISETPVPDVDPVPEREDLHAAEHIGTSADFGAGIRVELERLRRRLAEVQDAEKSLQEAKSMVERRVNAIRDLKKVALASS